MTFENIKYAIAFLAFSYVCYRLCRLLELKDEERGLSRLERVLFAILFNVGFPGGFLLGWIDRVIEKNK